jgi:hypothetical protein
LHRLQAHHIRVRQDDQALPCVTVYQIHQRRLALRISAGLAIVLMTAIGIVPSSGWTREKQIRRAAKHQRVSPPTTQFPKEPFTAEEKRKFQEPTGKEVDRW